MPGARTLLYDSAREVGQIDVVPFRVINGEEQCKDMGAVVGAQGASGRGVVVNSARAATHAGDPGCIMSIQFGELFGLLLTRVRDNQSVAVRCLGKDATLDGASACDQMIHGLRLE